MAQGSRKRDPTSAGTVSPLGNRLACQPPPFAEASHGRKLIANVLTVVWANRAYAILTGELAKVGARNPGPKALDMLSLDNPALDWVSLARGMGVPGLRAETADELVEAIRTGLKENGPFLVEAVL